MGSLYLCFTFILFTISVMAPIVRCQDTVCNSSDLRALINFTSSFKTGIEEWNISSSNCCTWTGVSCDNSTLLSKRVIGLELANRKLSGVVSIVSLASLHQLRILNLSQNLLRGYVADELFHLQNLEVLDLSNNEFTGQIPAGIDLPSIRYIDISMNRFTGFIDAKIFETSSEIQVVNLADNYFAGEVLETFGRCTSLQHLFLNGNNFIGSFPESLFQLRILRVLQLQDNQFSGPLNDGIGNLSNLVKLDISSNGFSGILPDVFGRLVKLEHLHASSNNFTGYLPNSLVNSKSLLTLDLRNNTFNGPINLNCSAMIQLTHLDLGSNSFHGPLPESLSACERLRVVNFARNKLSGEVPYSFKNLQDLTFLSLSNTSLVNISTALRILQHCKNLTTLVLSMNFRYEQMPDDANLQFKNIKALVIANCQLRGSIPAWAENCKMLQLLDLSWNFLDGPVPLWIGNFNYLFYLDLSNNYFTGEIPKSLTELHTLINRSISLEGTALNIPYLFRKPALTSGGLQYKGISSFPPTLDLSYNKFRGPLWPGFGNLKGLHVLNLKNNNLPGSIPDNFSEMSSLEILDLSYNKLSGEIPTSLVWLTFLSKFNVSYNQLYGTIPTGGQFMTFPDSSFEGNKALCGRTLSPCLAADTPGEQQPVDQPQKGKMKIVDLPFGVGVVTGFVLTVSFCFNSGWVFQKAKKRKTRVTQIRR